MPHEHSWFPVTVYILPTDREFPLHGWLEKEPSLQFTFSRWKNDLGITLPGDRAADLVLLFKPGAESEPWEGQQEPRALKKHEIIPKRGRARRKPGRSPLPAFSSGDDFILARLHMTQRLAALSQLTIPLKRTTKDGKSAVGPSVEAARELVARDLVPALWGCNLCSCRGCLQEALHLLSCAAGTVLKLLTVLNKESPFYPGPL